MFGYFARLHGKYDLPVYPIALFSYDAPQRPEPNRYRETSLTPNDPSFPSQWGLTKINCPSAWDRTTGSGRNRRS